MWSGELRTIRFEFTSPSVQAVLDKLLTARIIEREGKKCLIEAETYGNGIKMWRLSQGRWVKVVVPKDFVEEIKAEIDKMQIYTKNEETRFPFNRATVCSVDGV